MAFADPYFDNLSLRREPAQTYRYDENGNLVSATQTDSGNKSATCENGVDLTQYTAANGESTGAGGNLKSTTYGNGQHVTYAYDDLDRLIRTQYNSGRYITYAYSAEGQISRIAYGDGSTAKGSYDFEYDSLGRLIRSVEYDGSGTVKQRTEHLYDAYNRLSSQSWISGGTPYTESYTYSDGENGDGSITKMTTATGDTISYTYDALKRLQKTATANASGTTLFTTAYAFRTVSGNQTSSQIEYRNVRIGTNGTILEGKKYTYDALGNIIGIYESTDLFRQLVAYTYDSQNQLLSETYYTYSGTSTTPATTNVYSYTYDTAGNILTASKNGTVTQTCTYGNSQWRDLLTAVNGNAISYDTSGNPTSWNNGKSYTGLTWVNGRQLSAITTGGTRTTYAYDADGIRSSKNVGSTVHTYLTQSGKVVRETIGSGSTAKVLDFIYDESGKPCALKYSTNGGSSFTTYYYVLNLQGDVVKLVTSSDTAVATYTYDAWGNLLTSSGTMASVNPLRYRGYYYDTETGFYYVSSRYYDSEIGRFINADDIDYLGADGSPLSYNLFAYCMNDPINRFDVDGNWSLSNWVKVAIGVAAIAVGVCVTALTGGAALPALSAGVKAACVAGAISAGTSAAKTAVCSAMSGDSFSTVLHKSAKAAVDGFADGFMAGGIAAGASQVASGGFKIAAKLGAKTGKGGGIKIGDAKILSPDAAWHKNNGGTLLKIGNTFRIDVGSNTLLHMHLPNASSHIQIGTIGAGIYGGLK